MPQSWHSLSFALCSSQNTVAHLKIWPCFETTDCAQPCFQNTDPVFEKNISQAWTLNTCASVGPWSIFKDQSGFEKISIGSFQIRFDIWNWTMASQLIRLVFFGNWKTGWRSWKNISWINYELMASSLRRGLKFSTIGGNRRKPSIKPDLQKTSLN